MIWDGEFLERLRDMTVPELVDVALDCPDDGSFAYAVGCISMALGIMSPEPARILEAAGPSFDRSRVEAVLRDIVRPAGDGTSSSGSSSTVRST